LASLSPPPRNIGTSNHINNQPLSALIGTPADYSSVDRIGAGKKMTAVQQLNANHYHMYATSGGVGNKKFFPNGSQKMNLI
jgi:hypothetical protein